MTEKQKRNLIVKLVADEFGIRVKDIMGRDRHVPLPEARQMAMVIVRLHVGLTLEGTGRLFSRDHGTVLHAERVLRQRLTYCKQTKAHWAAVQHLAARPALKDAPEFQI